MNRDKTNWLIGSLVMMLGLAEPTWAVSAFNSTAKITYTIESIVNNSNPGSVTGLEIDGLFSLDSDGSDIYIPTGSDAVVTPLSAINEKSVYGVVSSFSHELGVTGNVTDGIADAFYLGVFELFFENESNDTFDIAVSLAYQLNSEVSGQFAINDIQLDYSNDSGDFSSAVEGVFAVAETPFDVNDIATGSDVYTFTLAPGGFDALFADVIISASLEASPVPVPGAAWLFASALLIPMIKTRHKL